MTSRQCITCGERLRKMVLGDLGHGGSAWWECENKCNVIWK